MLLAVVGVAAGCRALVGERHMRIVAARLTRTLVFLSDGSVTLHVWLLLLLASQISMLLFWAAKIVNVRRVCVIGGAGWDE